MSNLEHISDHPVWNYCFNLLLDSSISEVEANGRDSFFINKGGNRLKLKQVKMGSDEEYLKSIEVGLIPHITSHVPFDPTGYIFEGPLRFTAEVNGVEQSVRGRCHIILPPAADSPQITIAKKSTSLTTLDDIASRGSMPAEILKFVKASIAADLTTTISGGTGAGKALHKDTLIPTPNGFVTMGSLGVGDTVFDETGARATVERKYCPMDPKSYEVTFSNGQKIRTSAGHLWKVVRPGYTRETSENLGVLSTEEMESTRNEQGWFDLAIEMLSRSVDYSRKNLARDPYDYGYELESREISGRENVIDDYVHADTQQRVDFISGLIDTQGEILNEGKVEIELSGRDEVKALWNIVFSLGWECARPVWTEDTFESKSPEKKYYVIILPEYLNLRNKEKKIAFDQSRALSKGFRNLKFVYVIEIKEIQDNPADYFCISVDSPSHLFLAGETFIPTHNTTFLEAMCKLIPLDTRIGIAEDTPELELPHENTSYYHSVPARPGMDEKDVASLSWCVAQFNRARTDKLIIGETRGKEFADFLVAANSGMEGSLTTIHANDPVRALDKMTNFALKGSPGTPIRSVNTDIGSSIDIIIQLARFKADGRYRLTAIQEITSTVSVDDRASLTTNRLYTYDYDSDTWMKEANPTDALRTRFLSHGVDISEIMKTQPGTRLLPMGSAPRVEAREPQRSSGLPVRRI